MEYLKIEPSPTLKPWVKCFYYWKGNLGKKLVVQSPPSSCGAVVFNFGNAYESVQDNKSIQKVPRDFVCGLFTSNYELKLEGCIDMLGAVLTPIGIHNFFGTRMSALVNSRMEISLLSDARLVELREQMIPNGDLERIKLLQAYFEQLLPIAISRTSIIDEAFQFIDDSNGLVEVARVAEKFSISKRYLEKRFLIKVGVSPKTYARLRRFTAISIPVAHSNKMDWQTIVEEFGLHDQSHLVKEFMTFNKMSPEDYIKNHHEMSRFLKAKREV